MVDVDKFIQRHWDCFVPSTIGRDDRFVITGARGCEVFDSDGKRYLDFCSQAGVANIGHNHPFFVKAQKIYWDAIEKKRIPWFLIASDFHFYFDVEVDGIHFEISQVALAERLKRHAFGNDTRFIQQVTGVTTNNAAVKFVQKFSDKTKGFAFEGAFQGRQGTALAATLTKPVQRQGFDIPAGIEHLPFVQNKYMLEYVLRKLKMLSLEDYRFIIFELIQGEGGVNLANEYTIQLLRFLQDKGVILICDDIQEGFGRTGTWWSYENFDLVPDMVTISKAFGGGDSIGAVFFNGTNPKFSGWEEKFETGWDSSTFQWNPHAVFAAIITLHILEEEKLVEKAKGKGIFLSGMIDGAIEQYLLFYDSHKQLHSVKKKGFGLHYGLEFSKHERIDEVADPHFRNLVLRHLHEQGIVTLSAGNPDINPTIRIAPPLVITEDEMNESGKALALSLAKAREEL